MTLVETFFLHDILFPFSTYIIIYIDTFKRASNTLENFTHTHTYTHIYMHTHIHTLTHTIMHTRSHLHANLYTRVEWNGFGSRIQEP